MESDTPDSDLADKKFPSAQQKLFTPVQILLLSLFGTVLAGYAGFILNYRSLGCKRSCYYSIVAGLIFFPLIIGLALSLPRTPFDRAWPALLSLLMLVMANTFQGKLIQQKMIKGRKEFRGQFRSSGDSLPNS